MALELKNKIKKVTVPNSILKNHYMIECSCGSRAFRMGGFELTAGGYQLVTIHCNSDNCDAYASFSSHDFPKMTVE